MKIKNPEGVIMLIDLPSKIGKALESISKQYYKIILVCEYGKGSAVKAVSKRNNLPLLNINLLLSNKLMEYPRKRMSGKVNQLFGDILKEAKEDTICLEHIDILFDPILKQNPLQLLQNYSRSYTLVVSWRGSYDGKRFSYAMSGHPEYYEQNEFDGVVIF